MYLANIFSASSVSLILMVSFDMKTSKCFHMIKYSILSLNFLAWVFMLGKFLLQESSSLPHCFVPTVLEWRLQFHIEPFGPAVIYWGVGTKVGLQIVGTFFHIHILLLNNPSLTHWLQTSSLNTMSSLRSGLHSSLFHLSVAGPGHTLFQKHALLVLVFARASPPEWFFYFRIFLILARYFFQRSSRTILPSSKAISLKQPHKSELRDGNFPRLPTLPKVLGRSVARCCWFSAWPGPKLSLVTICAGQLKLGRGLGRRASWRLAQNLLLAYYITLFGFGTIIL